MKITLKELKRLISEQVKETLREQTGSSLPVGPPAPEATSGTNPRQAALIQSAVQACNLIFEPGISYSFYSHLTRLKRGLETGDPRVANYELEAHNAHVTLLGREKYFAIANMFAGPEESVQPWRRGMPAVVPSEATLQRFTRTPIQQRFTSLLGQIRNALNIEGVNRPGTMYGWPRDMSRINSRLRMEMISKIQAALTVLDSGRDMCQLISQGPEAFDSTPPTPPTPSSTSSSSTESSASMSISERRIRRIKRR